MKRSLPPLALCLALIACGSPAGTGGNGGVTMVQAAFLAEGGYIAARRVMAAYEAGQFGVPKPATLTAMHMADDVAYGLLVPLRSDAQAGRPVAQAAIDELTTAVAALATINATAGAR